MALGRTKFESTLEPSSGLNPESLDWESSALTTRLFSFYPVLTFMFLNRLNNCAHVHVSMHLSVCIFLDIFFRNIRIHPEVLCEKLLLQVP